MFRDLVHRAFDVMFEHLGDTIQYRSRDNAPFQVIAIIKQPENAYDIGDSQIVDQVAEVTVKATDVRPRTGDNITDGSKTYKIYSTPLLDASNYVWKFFAVLVGKE